MPTVEIIAPYKPLPWQLNPLRDKSIIVLLTGAAGGGKSRTAAEKVHAYCKKYPGAVGIALRKAREFASKSVVYALKSAIGDDKDVRYNSSDLTFYYANGSKIFIAGMKDESQRQALRSINGDGSADIIWGEEANALTEDDHNELLARMRGKASSWRQIIYTTNPDTPIHWIKQRLMDGGEAKVYYSRARDNPYNPSEYLQTLDMLTGVQGKRLRDGLWVQAEGVVYEEFDDSIHVVDPFPIPYEWNRYRSIDFGYVNPFCCQWWAVDHDGRLYLYREMYMTQRTVNVHGKQINKLSDHEKIIASVADHDAEDRATLREQGIQTLPAKKEISRGIQKVAERLKVQGDGKPRLFVFRCALVEEDSSIINGRPRSTLQEFPSYIWPKGVDGKALKEVPVDDNNHGMDAMRYMVMHLDGHIGWPSRILTVHSTAKKSDLPIALCSEADAADFLADNDRQWLMVHVSNPGEEMLPGKDLGAADFLALQFTADTPETALQGWEKVYQKAMQKEHGKRLWSWLKRDRGNPGLGLLVVDNDAVRGASIAAGVAAELRQDAAGFGEVSEYIKDMTRAGRGMVI